MKNKINDLYLDVEKLYNYLKEIKDTKEDVNSVTFIHKFNSELSQKLNNMMLRVNEIVRIGTEITQKAMKNIRR